MINLYSFFSPEQQQVLSYEDEATAALQAVLFGVQYVCHFPNDGSVPEICKVTFDEEDEHET